jgi:hypothetical protein
LNSGINFEEVIGELSPHLINILIHFPHDSFNPQLVDLLSFFISDFVSLISLSYFGFGKSLMINLKSYHTNLLLGEYQ